MLLQDFVVLHFMDIDQTPSRKWAGASSCYLKTEYADDSVLDTVVVGFCNPLIAFIRKPEQISLHNCAANQFVQFLIY